MAEYKLDGEEGKFGATMNPDAPQDSFTDLHVDARSVAINMFNQHMSANVRVLIDAGYPIAMLLDCMLTASCEHYALGIINLVDRDLLPEEKIQSVIDGLGPAIVEMVRKSYDELLPQFKEELARDME